MPVDRNLCVAVATSIRTASDLVLTSNCQIETCLNAIDLLLARATDIQSPIMVTAATGVRWRWRTWATESGYRVQWRRAAWRRHRGWGFYSGGRGELLVGRSIAVADVNATAFGCGRVSDDMSGCGCSQRSGPCSNSPITRPRRLAFVGNAGDINGDGRRM